MNTAQLTPRALDVIADSGETGETVFRTPCSVGSGEVLTDAQVDAAIAAWFTTEDAYHGPSFRQRMRAAIAAATEGAES